VVFRKTHIPSVPPRPCSVAGHAESRRLIATASLLALPLMASFAWGVSSDLAVLVMYGGIALVAILSILDVLALADAVRAARRLARGLPPPRERTDYGIGLQQWVRITPAGNPYRAQDRVELVAIGSPAAAARMLARNLVCRALAVGLPVMALVGGDARVIRGHRCQVSSVAKTALSTIRSATMLYLSAHPEGGCPTVSQLKAERFLDPSFSEWDPWGKTWTLRCDDHGIVGVSSGPDRRLGTQDDIVVPAVESE
jgi:hypothetical protein